MTSSLSILNSATQDDALAMIEALVECSPWVAKASLAQRPFASHEALSKALVKVILGVDMEKQIALFNVHPQLAGAEAMAGSMTKESSREQDRLGLMCLSSEEAGLLNRLNATYKTKFGYPFIIALHRVPDRRALFDIFEQRITMSEIEEHMTSLAEIASVISSRCRQTFGNAAASQTPSTEIQGVRT